MNKQENLFDEWNLYDKIGRSNTMRQREISAAIRNELSKTTTPLRVLDLGCGDGWMLYMVLAESVVARFVGVELSESAIDRLTRRALPGIRPDAGERKLVLGDIAIELRQLPTRGFDLVHAGYSLHHYTTEAKPAVLDEIARVLDTEGRLFWTDIIRAEGETREGFVQRLADNVHATWLDISPEERKSVIDHMWKCDYSEPESWMVREMESRGLRLVGRLFRDEFYASYLFQKPC